jgi:hypothetical protein
MRIISNHVKQSPSETIIMVKSKIQQVSKFVKKHNHWLVLVYPLLVNDIYQQIKSLLLSVLA